MTRSSATLRGLARRHDRERRQIVVGRSPEVAPDNDADERPSSANFSAEDPAPVIGVEAAPGANASSSIPTTTTQSTPSQTPTETTNLPAVHIPTSLSTVIPATCGVIGVLIACFLVWHFWYRKRSRKMKTNQRSTWYQAGKYNEDFRIEPMPSSKVETYPPAKITPIKPRTASLPARDQRPQDRGLVKPAAKSLPVPIPSSPLSPADEKTTVNVPDVNVVTHPPTAVHKHSSFVKDVNKMPDFRGIDPHRVQPCKRSASLLSSRMSVRRKPHKDETSSSDPAQPVIPSLRITDADSPLEDSKPMSHPLEGKLVTVTDPYEALMPDELTVSTGETLRVIEVYDDEWCLAERVGRKKGRGILPQIYVNEKSGVQPRMRFSMLMRE